MGFGIGEVVVGPGSCEIELSFNSASRLKKLQERWHVLETEWYYRILNSSPFLSTILCRHPRPSHYRISHSHASVPPSLPSS
jgi:methyltransferase-like protein